MFFFSCVILSTLCTNHKYYNFLEFDWSINPLIKSINWTLARNRTLVNWKL